MVTGSVTHASATLTVNYSGTPTNIRVRIAASPATCTGGTGGYVTGSTTDTLQVIGNPQMQPVVGLSPSTTYQLCPELTSNGSNWYGGVAATVTTLPLPNPHPALPVAPVAFDTTYPNTTGYTTYNLNSSCVDSANGNTLQQDLNAALTNQATQGAIISIAAGAVCRGQIYLSQTAADTTALSSSAINTTNNTITVAQNSFNEGDIFVCGSNYQHGPCPGNVLVGQNYAVHVVSNTGGSEVIQLYFPLPQSMGGTLVNFGGNAGNAPYYYGRHNVNWGQNYGQRNLNWIIIRPSTPDTEFVPAGTRLQGPIDSTGHPSPPTSWLPKMYTLTMPDVYQGIAPTNTLFSLSDEDGNVHSMNGYIRIVGAHFTFDRAQDASGGKPMPHNHLFTSAQWNSDALIDRCWFDPPGHPDEQTGILAFDGTDIGMVDSYSDNFDYYHPAFTGMSVALVNTGQFTIGAGTYTFGNGPVTLPSTVTVNTSGTTSAAASGYVYFGMDGSLYVSLPPGVSGTCSGYSKCFVFSTQSSNNTGYYSGPNSSPGVFPNTAGGGNGYLFAVEPVVSTSSSCSSTTSLFPAAWYNGFANAVVGSPSTSYYDIGTRFWPDTNLYLCGISYYRDTQDTSASHMFTLWGDSGNALYQFTSSQESTAVGKVTVTLPTPQALTAAIPYRVGYSTLTGTAQYKGAFENYDPNAGQTNTVHTDQYLVSNGNLNYSDNWPLTFSGRPAFGMFAILTFNTNGLTAASNNVDVFGDGFNTEGCQCMVSGLGPGPRVMKDNYTVASGNVWHFDDSGGANLSRHDFTVYRNYFYAPLSMMFTSDGSNPASDGMMHGHRHSLEWKQGNCAAIVGNIFDTSWVEDTPYGDLFEISALNGALGVCGATNEIIWGSSTDFDLRSNTFMHAASIESVMGPGTRGFVPSDAQRFRFTNNLIMDISGTKYCAVGDGFCPYAAYGSGLNFSVITIEDVTVSHNTMVENNSGSRLPFLFLTGGNNEEGVSVHDNIFWINGTSNGLGGIQSDSCGYTNGTDSGCWGTGTYCKALDGSAGFNCAFVNSTWFNNLMLGSPSQSQIQSLWPNNIVPSNPSNLNAVGWVNYISTSVPGNYELRSTSPYNSGGTNPASDGHSVGIDFNQLQIDQGYVTLVGTSNVTASSAQINFVAPDAQSCPVDYSPTDPTVSDNSLVRVSDTGTGRTRNVVLSGLSAGQIYYFRVNCAVNQPMGQFKTQ